MTQAETTIVKHTPGPWEAVDSSVHAPNELDNKGDSAAICTTWPQTWKPGDESLAIMRANARFIAAAPDLLAACELALAQIRRLDPPGAYMNPASVQLRAAIAKATGTNQ